MPDIALLLSPEELQWLAAKLGRAAAMDLANTGGDDAVLASIFRKVQAARDRTGRPPLRLLGTSRRHSGRPRILGISAAPPGTGASTDQSA